MIVRKPRRRILVSASLAAAVILSVVWRTNGAPDLLGADQGPIVEQLSALSGQQAVIPTQLEIDGVGGRERVVRAKVFPVSAGVPGPGRSGVPGQLRLRNETEQGRRSLDSGSRAVRLRAPPLFQPR